MGEPARPDVIDPATRDIVENIYIQKVEKVGGKLVNVVFGTVPNVKDPCKSGDEEISTPSATTVRLRRRPAVAPSFMDRRQCEYQPWSMLPEER